jgi:5'-nucleotidase
MKRRRFLSSAIASTALVGIGGLGSVGMNNRRRKRITILHTNDVHSHIEPFGPDAGRNANKGGVARRSTLVETIRQQNPNTLLLDAGDIFQGTPYFNYYGGELEFKLMSMLKYDAATIGNHDFDNGIDGLLAQLPHAQFDFLSANYDFSNTVLDGLTKPYKVFDRDGIKIGVFGLGIELEGLVNKKMYKETVYLDPIEMTQEMTALLKEKERCDLIICLSHLGYFLQK